MALAAVPLVLALALNLANRHRFQQQTQLYTSNRVADVHQVVQSLHQQVQALPTEPVDISPIAHSLSELTQKTETLTRQFNGRIEPRQIEILSEANTHLTKKTETLTQLFNSRPEVEQIEGLKQAIAALPPPPKIDLSPITQSLEQLEQKTETLAQQFNGRIEPRQIEILNEANAELKQKTETLTQLFNSRPEVEQIEGLKQAIAALPPPPKVDLSPITQSLEQLEQKTQTLTQQFNARPETEAIAQLTHQLNALLLRFDNLPSPPEPVDLSGIEAEIATLQAQVQGIDLNPLTSSIAQVKASLQTQIDQISRQMHDLPAPFAPSALEQQIVELESKNHSIFSDDVSSLVSVVKRLQSDSSLIEEVTERITCQLDVLAHEFSARPETEAVAQLTNQLEALAQRLDNLPTPPEPVDLSGILGEIADLNTKLSTLAHEFKTRPETEAVAQITNQFDALELRLNNLPSPPEPVDLSGIEAEIATLGGVVVMERKLTLSPKALPQMHFIMSQ